jgi:hypothetical protein
MEVKFKTDPLFAKAILKNDNLKGQSFVGMHNIDEIEKFAQQTIHTKPLLTYESKSVIGVVDGKTAYTVNTPKVFMPSIDDLKSINKPKIKSGDIDKDIDKVLLHRKWTTQGREIGKKEKISSTFLEGMDSEQVDKMISEAFVVRYQQKDSHLWYGIINYNEKKIRIDGYIRNNIIGSAFISKIE